jgi:hypothetical protein
MIANAVGNIAILLSICGVCPPSATSDRLPKRLDTLNTLFRLALVAGFCYSNLLAPGVVKQISPSKTYKVTLKIRTMPIEILLIKHFISSKGIAVLGALHTGAAQLVCDVIFANSWTLHLTYPPLKTQVICATHPGAGANFCPHCVPFIFEKPFCIVG